ncbi:MAG: helix-turn-helix transcriptional regulator [Verrucomicrobiaceae bacterium]|nr:helix-turn-helix transcriptional regulator [Verrucomicrobiaceae bacterium]
MKTKHAPTARKGAGACVNLETHPDAGPWDGCIDPDRGNTCVRRFMKWYRQRLDLSLHQVAALTGLDRAYLRRLERRRICLSLRVLWRWCNGLHVNVDWVLKLARRQALAAAADAGKKAGVKRGSLPAPCSSPAAVAECAHACDDTPLQPPPPGLPADGCGPEDFHFAHLPARNAPALHRGTAGLEIFLPHGRGARQGTLNGLPPSVLMVLVS